MTAAACRLCGNPVDSSAPLYAPDGGLRTAFRVHCSTCGVYDITEMMASNAGSLAANDRYRLSAITRAASEEGKPVELTTSTVADLLRTTQQPSPVEQVDLVLEYLDRQVSPGVAAPLVMGRDFPLVRALGPEALDFVIQTMVKDHLIEKMKSLLPDEPHFRIAMAGYERLKHTRDAANAPATQIGDGQSTKPMKLPHVVLKHIAPGYKLGDVVDAAGFSNFKLLLDQGLIRAATPEEVADWQTKHAAPTSAPTADTGTAPPTASPGKEFERWGVPLRELGAGGQGRVYLVRHPDAERRRLESAARIAMGVKEIMSANSDAHKHSWAIDLATALQAWSVIEESGLAALKEFQMPGSGSERDKALARLDAEIEALQKLAHPAVIRLLDANAKRGFIVTEYHPGGTLAMLLERSPERFKGNLLATLTMVRPLAEALVSIHGAGAVHRDVKPENIFVGQDGLVLGDFGIVIFQDVAGERLTETFERRAKGTRDWMAPWAYAGKRIALEDIDGTFDVFSLGKVLWVMLAGDFVLPFWYHDREDFDLEKRFPDAPHMRLANALLRKCVVEHRKDCASAADLLKLIDETLVLLKADGAVLDVSMKRPCRVCTKGKYEPDEQLGHLDLSGKPLMAMTFICDACGHVQMFRAPGKKLGPAWRST